jgi:exonuclease SbcC
MIPLNLTIEGLYSYRTHQTIDFTNLTQSGLFGIFGGVGSGKSSILEAISFALYGESERLNARDKRNYNMMNLKSKKLLIDFEFKSHNETIYKFVVQGKRNNNRFEDVGAFERKAYRLEKEDWVPIPTEEIETITGLNYQNFRRTIIIPQGRFQEFLQLSSTDRTTMLKELFNLTKYELSDKIARLDSKNNATIQYISGGLQEIGEIEPEKIAKMEKQKTDLQIEIGKLKLSLGEMEKNDQQAETLKKLIGAIKEHSKKFTLLQQSAADMKELERKLKEYELFSRIFRSDISQMEELKEKFRMSGDELTTNRAKQALQQQESEKLLPLYENLKKEYENRDQFIRESEELTKYAAVRNLRDEFSGLSGRAANGVKAVSETTLLVTIAKKQQTEAAKVLELLHKDLPDIRLLSAIKAWYTLEKELLKSMQEIQKKKEDKLTSLQNLNGQVISDLTNSGLFDSIPEQIDPAQYLDKIEVLKSGIEMELTKYSSLISELEISHKLEQYADALHDGMPCPLCGSEKHPRILNPTDVAKNLENVRTEKQSMEVQLRKCNECARSLTIHLTNRDSGLTQLQELLDELTKRQASEKKHAQEFQWKGFDRKDDRKLAEEEARYDQMKKAIENGEKQLKNNGVDLEKKGKLLEQYTEEQTRVEQKMIGVQTKMDLLEKQITLIDLDLYKEISVEHLLEMSHEFLSRHTALSAKFIETENKVNALNKSIMAISGQIGEMERNHAGLKGQLTKLQQKIEKQLRDHGGLDLSDVTGVLIQEMDIDETRAQVENFYRSVEVVKKSLDQLNQELDGRSYDEEVHQLVKDEILGLEHAIETMNREIGSLETVIQSMKRDAIKFASLKADLEKAELRKQDISELKNLFRSSGFVNYVSTVYLQNLCKAANERFYKLTRQKLGLELSEENSFEVRDYMNDGHLRNVKTLSGGQTFQASLSLALSLADSIHKLAASSENFFFLDEGFGTLDKETLEVAFDTLKALRKENRIVGVISHVEEMQMEIETFLKVTNDEERGSIVTGSWER